jgi:hypothetical protein
MFHYNVLKSNKTSYYTENIYTKNIFFSFLCFLFLFFQRFRGFSCILEVLSLCGENNVISHIDG